MTLCFSIAKVPELMDDYLIVADQVEVRRAAAEAEWLLHCNPADSSAVGVALGLTLDITMLRASPTDAWSALHLSPDEWLLIGPAGEGSEFAEQLLGCPAAVSLVDVSARALAYDIAGTGATDLLSGGCPLDLNGLAEGGCTRTLFGKAAIMLWRRGDSFRLSYSRSFDEYVTLLLRAIADDLASLPFSA